MGSVPSSYTLPMRLAIIALLFGCSNGHHASTDGGHGGACAGLSLGACRTTSGCVPDVCEGCGCDLNYRGCLATGETPAMCPALGCPSGICCTAEMPCASGSGTCYEPGADLGCGACNTDPGDCSTDQECRARTPGTVCDPIRCSCEGHSACTPGCTNDDACGEGQTCDLATNRCVAQACGACPDNFTCTAGKCARTTCTTSNDCDDGYCVDGACFGSRGTCTFPPP